MPASTERQRAVSVRPRLRLLVCGIGLALAVQAIDAAVKVRINFDKTFPFKQASTWAWNPQDVGDVVVARTPDDDPDQIRMRAEPLIMSAVSAEMPRRGLTLATGTPDLTLTYYLLLSVGSAAQTVGQFLPAVPEWGIPPFSASTQSLEVIERGALVLDLSANGRPVWRGIGEAKITMGLPQDERAALIREAVREILARYPPRQ